MWSTELVHFKSAVHWAAKLSAYLPHPAQGPGTFTTDDCRHHQHGLQHFHKSVVGHHIGPQLGAGLLEQYQLPSTAFVLLSSSLVVAERCDSFIQPVQTPVQRRWISCSSSSSPISFAHLVQLCHDIRSSVLWTGAARRTGTREPHDWSVKVLWSGPVGIDRFADGGDWEEEGEDGKEEEEDEFVGVSWFQRLPERPSQVGPSI